MTKESKSKWKFDQTENTATVTDKYIIDNKEPVLVVIHYSDDGSWAFLSGKTNDEKDGRVCSMIEILQVDKSLDKLYKLPIGFIAKRKTYNGKWKIEKNHSE